MSKKSLLSLFGFKTIADVDHAVAALNGQIANADAEIDALTDERVQALANGSDAAIDKVEARLATVKKAKSRLIAKLDLTERSRVEAEEKAQADHIEKLRAERLASNAELDDLAGQYVKQAQAVAAILKRMRETNERGMALHRQLDQFGIATPGPSVDSDCFDRSTLYSPVYQQPRLYSGQGAR